MVIATSTPRHLRRYHIKCIESATRLDDQLQALRDLIATKPEETDSLLISIVRDSGPRSPLASSSACSLCLLLRRHHQSPVIVAMTTAATTMIVTEIATTVVLASGGYTLAKAFEEGLPFIVWFLFRSFASGGHSRGGGDERDAGGRRRVGILSNCPQTDCG